MNVLLVDEPISNSVFQKPRSFGLKNIVAPSRPIPVSKSTWWAGVKSKRFPQPVKLGPKVTAWRVGEIRALIDKPEHRLDS